MTDFLSTNIWRLKEEICEIVENNIEDKGVHKCNGSHELTDILMNVLASYGQSLLISLSIWVVPNSVGIIVPELLKSLKSVSSSCICLSKSKDTVLSTSLKIQRLTQYA